MDTFSINGTVQSEYLYNALGQQVVRTLTQTGEVIHSIHDLDGNRIAEYSYDAGTGSSTLLREYIWMNGRAIGVVEGGQVFFIRTDHIGRPSFATNDLGVKVWEASYLPFGGVHTSTGGIDLRFPGQWFQSESGLHQNWMRDYDPTTGRYIQADPLGLVDGASVYGYALQNPGRYVDPRGEEAEVIVDGNNVLIRIPLEIRCDCPEELKQKVRNDIQAALHKYWSGKFGKYTVSTVITEIDSSDCCRGNKISYNQVTERQISQIYTLFGRVVGGRIDSLDTPRILAHECGHIMGLLGHNYPIGTIMNGGTKVTEDLITKIIEKNK